MIKKQPLRQLYTNPALIIYEHWGITCTRSKPHRLRHAAINKQRSKEFGLASRTAKCLRQLLAPVIPNNKSREMINRFNKRLYAWVMQLPETNNSTIKEAKDLIHFQFNGDGSITSRLRIPLAVELNQQAGITLNIPAMQPQQSIAAPANTHMVKWKIMAAVCNRQNLSIADTYSAELTMPYNSDLLLPKKIQLPIPLPATMLTSLVIGLEYHLLKNGGLFPVEDKNWQSCGIVGAWWR
ncbi:MAG: hypothetical protein ACM3H8_05355 [Sphingobacteriales bacterium]